MIRTAIINYKGLELECKGFHSTDKDNYGCFEIDAVFYKYTDVTELMNVLNFDWSELECLCLDSLKD